MKLHIPAHDTRIHVFAVSDSDALGVAHQTFLSRLQDDAATDTTLPMLFGYPALDPSGAEVFAIADVAAMGLRTYLAEAYDIAPETLQRDAAVLDALGGDVIILTPKALGYTGTELSMVPYVRHVSSHATLSADNAPRSLPEVDLNPSGRTQPDEGTTRKGSAVVVGVLLVIAVIILALVLAI